MLKNSEIKNLILLSGSVERITPSEVAVINFMYYSCPALEWIKLDKQHVSKNTGYGIREVQKVFGSLVKQGLIDRKITQTKKGKVVEVRASEFILGILGVNIDKIKSMLRKREGFDKMQEYNRNAEEVMADLKAGKL